MDFQGEGQCKRMEILGGIWLEILGGIWLEIWQEIQVGQLQKKIDILNLGRGLQFFSGKLQWLATVWDHDLSLENVFVCRSTL